MALFTDSRPSGRQSASPWGRVRRTTMIVGAIAAAAAVTAAFSSGRPTGVVVADVLWRMAFAGGVTLSAARARRWTWFVLAGAPAALAAGAPQVVALIGLAVALAAVLTDRWPRVAGAVVGFTAAQSLLRLPTSWPSRTSAALAAAAALPVAYSAYRRLASKARGRVRLAVLGGGLVLFVLSWGFALATVAARSRVEVGLARTRQAIADAQAGDSNGAGQQFALAATAFRSAHRSVSAWYLAPVRALPLVGPQATGLVVTTGQGGSLTRVAADTVRVADVQKVRFSGGAVDLGPVQAMGPALDRAASTLTGAERAVARIPRPWLVPQLADRLDALGKDVTTARTAADLTATAIARLPGILGADGRRHYLVLFTTPAESRNLGGFMGDFAEVTAEQGRVSLTRTGQVADLNDLFAPDKRITGVADFVEHYGSQRPGRYFQNVTASPHFPDVGDAVTQLYPQAPGGEPIDGVLLLDPYALAGLLSVTGPVVVPGLNEPLTAANAAELLLRRQYFLFDQGTAASPDQRLRYDFLGQASRVTFEALVSRATLPAPRQLVDLFGPLASQHRILAYSVHPDEQDLFRRVGLDGAFPRAGGDFVGLFETNGGANKLDAYLRRELDYKVTYDDRTGRTTATATIRLTNDVPPGPLPLETGSNLHGEPFATNQTQLRLYSPLLLDSITVNGADAPVGSENEFGLHVYTVAVSIPRGQTFTIVLHLDGAIRRGPYELTVAHQPLANDDHVHVRLQGVPGRRPAPRAPWLPTDGASELTFTLRQTTILRAPLRAS